MNKINIIKYLLLSAIIFTSCKSTFHSALSDADKQFIEKYTTSVQNGWNSGDRKTYVNRYSTDAIFMAPNMETIVGKDAIQAFANSFPEIKVQFSIKEIMGSGEYAYARGEYVLTTPSDSLFDKGKFLNVWRKVNDKWLITTDIFNSDLPVDIVK